MLGESLEYKATPKYLWRGTVASENEDDDDAKRALVLYDGAQPQLREAAYIPFPPPLLGNRQAEIWAAEIVQRPTEMPDMGVFGRPAPVEIGARDSPASAAAHSPAKETQKRGRSPDKEVEHYEALASALSGEKRMLTIAEHLRVPRNINAPFDVCYPMPWIGKPMEWRNMFMERAAEMRYLPENDRERRTLLTKRDAFASWLACAASRPTTKEEWSVPFLLLADITAGWAFALGGYEAKNRFEDAARAAWSEGTVDIEKMFNTATRPPPKQWRTQANGGGGGAKNHASAANTTAANAAAAAAMAAPKNGGQTGAKHGGFRGTRHHSKRF